jgi:hypothetical protein
MDQSDLCQLHYKPMHRDTFLITFNIVLTYMLHVEMCSFSLLIIDLIDTVSTDKTEYNGTACTETLKELGHR